MILTSSLIALALQVGPNPQAGGIQGVPEELLNRPPRPGVQESGQSEESRWLAQCLALLPDEAARAHTLAQVRRNETFGANRVLANHCLGLASTTLERWDDAVTAFQAARDETPVEELSARARFGAMAGNAALGGGEPARAIPILEAAKQDAQLAASANLQAIAAVDLARAKVAIGDNDGALAELDSATRLVPQDADAWLLKATLLRRLDRLGEAQSAIETAGELAGANAQIGLEAGLIAVLSGRNEAARSSWESVIAIAPASHEAQVARDYLAQLGASAPQETQ